MSNRIKRKQNAVDDRPSALMIGGPFNMVMIRVNALEEVIELGHDVDHRHRYGKMTDPDTGAYLGTYAWLDPDDAEA